MTVIHCYLLADSEHCLKTHLPAWKESPLLEQSAMTDVREGDSKTLKYSYLNTMANIRMDFQSHPGSCVMYFGKIFSMNLLYLCIICEKGH